MAITRVVALLDEARCVIDTLSEAPTVSQDTPPLRHRHPDETPAVASPPQRPNEALEVDWITPPPPLYPRPPLPAYLTDVVVGIRRPDQPGRGSSPAADLPRRRQAQIGDGFGPYTGPSLSYRGGGPPRDYGINWA